VNLTPYVDDRGDVRYELPLMQPTFWVPPWRQEAGLRIPFPPEREALPDGAVHIDAAPRRYLQRPSGLYVPPEPLPSVFWMIPTMAGFPPSVNPGSVVMHILEATFPGVTECPCPFCVAQRTALIDLEGVRPEPVYDAVPLSEDGVDNDTDPQWATRVDSSGPGLLLEELLDESTKQFIAKRDARRRSTPSERPR
jgi:hypothetical protein